MVRVRDITRTEGTEMGQDARQAADVITADYDQRIAQAQRGPKGAAARREVQRLISERNKALAALEQS